MNNITLKISKKVETKNVTIFMVFGLLAVFLILKMIRAFSGSSIQGGFWNYIQLFFIFLGSYVFLKHIYTFTHDRLCLPLMMYTFLAQINSLRSISFSRDVIFSFLMIAYPLCLLLILMKISSERRMVKSKIIVFTYYVIAVIYALQMMRSGTYSTAVGSISDAYYVLGLLPFVLVSSERKQIIPIIVSCIIVFISGKRAGLIAYILMILVYFLSRGLLEKNIKKTIGTIFSLLFISIISIFIFQSIVQNFNAGYLNKLEKMIYASDSAGRLERWNWIINTFKSAGVDKWLFGFGRGAVSHMYGGNAHNDFLEILFNYGLLPCLSYILFYVECIAILVKMKKSNYKYMPQFAMTITYSLVISMFSFYVITPTYITCGMICIGIIYAQFKVQKQDVEEERIS